MANENMFHKIINEICEENDILINYLSKDWVIELTKNNKTRYICGYKFDSLRHGLGEVFDDKYAMFSLLSSHNIPVIKHFIVYDDDNNNDYASDCKGIDYVTQLFEKCNRNIVMKANRGSCGVGVFHITDQDSLNEKYEHLLDHRPSFSVCPYMSIQNEFRAICVGGKIELLYKKTRPQVVGDGKKTIRELLKEFNNDYFANYESDISNNVLRDGEVFDFGWKFNLSKGSISSMEITNSDKEQIYRIVENIAKIIDLNFCSVDIIKTSDNKFLVMEINSGVMMKNFVIQQKNGYEIAKRIYTKAILNMMEN